MHITSDLYCQGLLPGPIACPLTEKCVAPYLSGKHHLAEVGNKQGQDHNGGTVGHPLTQFGFSRSSSDISPLALLSTLVLWLPAKIPVRALENESGKI